MRYGQCPCLERIKKQWQRWDGNLGRGDNRRATAPLEWEKRGCQCQIGAALVLTQSHEQAGQKSKMLCCVQHSAAREHCLLCLCFRESSSLQFMFQSSDCRIMGADLRQSLLVSSYGLVQREVDFFFPSKGQTGLKKTKETVYTLKENSLCEMDSFCYSE